MSKKLNTSLLMAGLALTGCGVDRLAESAAESAVERAIEAESGEHVDLDLSSGGISIETDEGSLQFDAETGEFELIDESGEQVGNGVFDDDGGIEATFESASGESVRAGVAVADEWPSEILAPYPGATTLEAAEYRMVDGVQRILALRTDDSLEQVFDFYDAATQGWSGTRATVDDSVFMMVTNETMAAQITASETVDGIEIGVVLVLVENMD